MGGADGNGNGRGANGYAAPRSTTHHASTHAKWTTTKPALRWTRGLHLRGRKGRGFEMALVDGKRWERTLVHGVVSGGFASSSLFFSSRTLKAVYASACVSWPITSPLMPRCGAELGVVGGGSEESCHPRYRYLRHPRCRNAFGCCSRSPAPFAKEELCEKCFGF